MFFKVLWTVEFSDGDSFCWHLFVRNSGVDSHNMRQYFLFRLDKPPFLNRQEKPGDFPGFCKTGFGFRKKNCTIVGLRTQDVLN
jgi:hypothetical protein